MYAPRLCLSWAGWHQFVMLQFSFGGIKFKVNQVHSGNDYNLQLAVSHVYSHHSWWYGYYWWRVMVKASAILLKLLNICIVTDFFLHQQWQPFYGQLLWNQLPVWNQLPSFLHYPYFSLSVSYLPVHAPTTSSHSVNSPLSPSISPSVFHFWLKTYLFHKSFPPWTLFRPQDWLHGLYDWTFSSEHFGVFVC